VILLSEPTAYRTSHYTLVDGIAKIPVSWWSKLSILSANPVSFSVVEALHGSVYSSYHPMRLELLRMWEILRKKVDLPARIDAQLARLGFKPAQVGWMLRMIIKPIVHET